MVKLENVSKRYGSNLVVDRVSLEIGAAETTALIGPSGCGKSTLLRMLAGLVKPDQGTVRVGDELFSDATCRSIRNKLGYVIQDGGLFPHLTAESNISLSAKLRGWSSERIGDRVNELVELAHFPPDGLLRYPAQLSGGQRQRVGLMRALMTDPDVLLLDEPLGALDPMIRHQLQQELREIFTQLGKCVLIVTHELTEASFFANQIVLMRSGRTEQAGSASELVNNPVSGFVTQFVQAQRTTEFGAPS